MRVQSALLIALAASLLLSVGLGAAATDDVPGEDGPQDVRIELTADGDAIWSVDHHYVLEDEDDVDRFESFANEVRTGQRDIANYRATFENFRPHAEANTDRSMPIENAGWDDPQLRSIDEVDAVDADEGYSENATVGTLTYTFTWSNFAGTDDGYLTVQDAFLTERGDPWFSTVGPEQRLHIEGPAEHDFVTAPHGIDNGTLTWDGPQELDADEFDVVLVSRSGPLSLSWMLVLGAVILVAAASAIWYGRTHENWDEPSVPDWFPTRETAADATTDGHHHHVDEELTATSVDDDSDDTTPIDPELLSDEERVTRMLEANGGRMKQAAIVSETGWSNAKVSQLLSKMDDEDDIEKLRIGRENLITLPDVDPTQVE